MEILLSSTNSKLYVRHNTGWDDNNFPIDWIDTIPYTHTFTQRSRVPRLELGRGQNKKNGNQSPIVENEKLFCLVSCFQRPEARSPDCDPSVPPDRSIATDFIDKINCSKFGCSMFHLMRWSQLISYLGNRFITGYWDHNLLPRGYL